MLSMSIALSTWRFDALIRRNISIFEKRKLVFYLLRYT